MISLFWLIATTVLIAPSRSTDPCANGSCPTPDYSSPTEECNLWMGPSPIKEAEQHGFGLGVFTGKHIPKGQTLNEEVLLALFGSTTIYYEHPPLREYIWDEMNFPEVPLEYPHDETAMFVPGIAAMVPCTSHNYNIEWAAPGTADKPSMSSHNHGVHRNTHPTAGSFPYRSVNVVATRDIFPGEEFTLSCSDDTYDGGAYFLNRYNATDSAVTCLDQVQPIPTPGMGRGLEATRAIRKGATILSSPVVPLHRREMDIEDKDINAKQQMLNYCYGHPDSDLLLLPFGPLVNFINHGDTPNAVIQWHKKSDSESLERRLQYHHQELFELPAQVVAETHGKGLVVDIVALRDIRPHEEIRIDYGPHWREAWNAHSWTPSAVPYQSAADYLHSGHEKIRTVTEQEVQPYPENLETFCFYHLIDETSSEFQGEQHNVLYLEYDDNVDHVCFRPCRILERHDDRFTVQFSHNDNLRIIDWCVIEGPMIMSNYPAHNIRLVDRPYSTDEFLQQSFRHEIGVEGLFPEAWKRKQLRRSSTTDTGDEFKRRSAVVSLPKAKRVD